MNKENIEILKKLREDLYNYSIEYNKIDYLKARYALEEELEFANTLQSNWNSLRECIIGVIDGAREELNTIMHGDDLEYINKCSLQYEAIRKNLEIVLDKMNELEGVKND